MENENIGTVAESAGEAESFNDEEFYSGLFDGEDFNEEEEENLFDEGETEEKEAQPEAQEEKEAESEPEPVEEPKEPEEKLSFVEHGKTFSVPKKAAESLAEALGISPAQLIDIYQKGCAFDSQKAKLEAAQKDGAVINELARLRGITADDLRAEINAQIEQIPLDQALAQIKAEHPGIPDGAAAELAKLRIEAQKPKAEEPKAEENTEEDAARLREVDMFISRHAAEGITALPNEVIEAWKKTNISLEEAFQNFKVKARNEELEKEIAELKKEKAKDEQRTYAKEHSPGSSSSAAGKVADEFVEALFA